MGLKSQPGQALTDLVVEAVAPISVTTGTGAAVSGQMALRTTGPQWLPPKPCPVMWPDLEFVTQSHQTITDQPPGTVLSAAETIREAPAGAISGAWSWTRKM